MDISPLIFDHFKLKFKEIHTTLIKALNQLDDQQVNWRTNEQSNSIANLVVHIQGNINQRIGSSILGHLDHRNRDSEFDTELYVPKVELIEIVKDSFDLAIHAVENLSAADLITMHKIRDTEKTTYEVLAQCIAHFSEHLGQVLYIAKICLGEDYQTTSMY